MTCPGELISRQWLSYQHHSAEGTVLDQMAEGFGGVAELIGSFGRVEGEMIACLLVRTSAPEAAAFSKRSGRVAGVNSQLLTRLDLF